LRSADYVLDQWQFSGNIDLSNSPWALESQPSTTPAPAQKGIQSETLNNVFIDWGDGTVEPFTIQWQGTQCGNETCFASDSQSGSASLFDLDTATNTGAFGHAYTQAQQYTVRVYALPAAAVQQGGALSVSLKGGGGGLFGKLMSSAGASVTSSGSSATADEAFQLFCQTVDIQHRTDEDAIGELKLASIRITGFPDSSGSTKPSGVAQAHGAAPAHGAAQARDVGHEAVRAPPAAATPIDAPGRPRGGTPAGGNDLPEFSSCDVSLVGGASVDFWGQGTAKLTWYQDGVVVG
jgi:hypothetical protein